MNDDIKPYWQSIAEEYDELSLWNKGEREAHLFYLEAMLRLKKDKCSSFLELGCGTGFFTASFYKIFPTIYGVIVDGSSQMLDIAANRIQALNGDAEYLCRPLQDIDVSNDFKQHFDVVFSALTIHHLADHNKRKLFGKIYDCLKERGVFILYDIFKSFDKRTDELFEQLSSLHMQMRLKNVLSVDFELDELSLDNIIHNDRTKKAAEGDCEASVEQHLLWLREVGFSHTCIFYMENRFFGAIASK